MSWISANYCMIVGEGREPTLLLRYVHNPSTKELADRSKFIVTSSQSVQKHIMAICALVLRFSDCTDRVIVLSANRAIAFEISILPKLNIQTFVLVEAVLTQKVSGLRVSF